jgi:hypothetical protein
MLLKRLLTYLLPKVKLRNLTVCEIVLGQLKLQVFCRTQTYSRPADDCHHDESQNALPETFGIATRGRFCRG